MDMLNRFSGLPLVGLVLSWLAGRPFVVSLDMAVEALREDALTDSDFCTSKGVTGSVMMWSRFRILALVLPPLTDSVFPGCSDVRRVSVKLTLPLDSYGLTISTLPRRDVSIA